MSDRPRTAERQAMPPATLASYVSGFVLSVVLTIVAYVLTVRHELSARTLLVTIAGLAIVQFLVQLLFFLHLGRETKPRWKTVAFLFMMGVVAIVVFGSLWIMSNLNYHMSSSDVNKYMNNQDGL